MSMGKHDLNNLIHIATKNYNKELLEKLINALQNSKINSLEIKNKNSEISEKNDINFINIIKEKEDPNKIINYYSNNNLSNNPYSFFYKRKDENIEKIISNYSNPIENQYSNGNRQQKRYEANKAAYEQLLAQQQRDLDQIARQLNKPAENVQADVRAENRPADRQMVQKPIIQSSNNQVNGAVANDAPPSYDDAIESDNKPEKSNVQIPVSNDAPPAYEEIVQKDNKSEKDDQVSLNQFEKFVAQQKQAELDIKMKLEQNNPKPDVTKKN